jgi:hypothetical protein
MTGGINIFLPSSQDEAKENVVGAAIVEGQPVVTIKEMEKISEDAQEKEEEHLDKIPTPWEMELEMLEDWLNHP